MFEDPGPATPHFFSHNCFEIWHHETRTLNSTSQNQQHCLRRGIELWRAINPNSSSYMRRDNPPSEDPSAARPQRLCLMRDGAGLLWRLLLWSSAGRTRMSDVEHTWVTDHARPPVPFDRTDVFFRLQNLFPGLKSSFCRF